MKTKILKTYNAKRPNSQSVVPNKNSETNKRSCYDRLTIIFNPVAGTMMMK